MRDPKLRLLYLWLVLILARFPLMALGSLFGAIGCALEQWGKELPAPPLPQYFREREPPPARVFPQGESEEEWPNSE